ncbi:MAG: tail fiber domain-containing protein, partial [Gammaproteobacteria bacterium]|nr:tail fiber domain-containing protein [Gammaproteobacteria bacterium]
NEADKKAALAGNIAQSFSASDMFVNDNLTVADQVNAGKYCDAQGQHCFTASEVTGFFSKVNILDATIPNDLQAQLDTLDGKIDDDITSLTAIKNTEHTSLRTRISNDATKLEALLATRTNEVKELIEFYANDTLGRLKNDIGNVTKAAASVGENLIRLVNSIIAEIAGFIGNLLTKMGVFFAAKFNAFGVVFSSDERLKKNIVPLTDATDTIMQLKGVSYQWRQDEFPDRNLPAGNDIGLIAQDVEKVIPEVVVTDKQGYKSLIYAKLTAVLVEAFKERQQSISTLRDDIALLKAHAGI